MDLEITGWIITTNIILLGIGVIVVSLLFVMPQVTKVEGIKVVFNKGSSIDSIISINSIDQDIIIVQNPIPKITNLSVCPDFNRPCRETFPFNNVMIYWEVPGSIGCCSTFSCDYNTFKSFCGNPFDFNNTFKLYDIYLDGELYNWNETNTWTYVCSNNTPWNYIYFKNLSVEKTYNVTIKQKDCINIIDEKSIIFSLYPYNHIIDDIEYFEYKVEQVII